MIRSEKVVTYPADARRSQSPDGVPAASSCQPIIRPQKEILAVVSVSHAGRVTFHVIVSGTKTKPSPPLPSGVAWRPQELEAGTVG